MPVNRAKFHFDNTYAGMDMLYGPYVLYQIGDLSCEAGYQTFEHEQAVYEITYVLSGTGAFYVDDTVYTMQKGDLLLVRKGQMHNIISAEIEPLRFFYLGFDFVEPIVNESLYSLVTNWLLMRRLHSLRVFLIRTSRCSFITRSAYRTRSCACFPNSFRTTYSRTF